MDSGKGGEGAGAMGGSIGRCHHVGGVDDNAGPEVLGW